MGRSPRRQQLSREQLPGADTGIVGIGERRQRFRGHAAFVLGQRVAGGQERHDEQERSEAAGTHAGILIAQHRVGVKKQSFGQNIVRKSQFPARSRSFLTAR
ncbi:hypothetical protein ACVW1A_002256 [Bradyrhizobium sp. LB1.3]